MTDSPTTLIQVNSDLIDYYNACMVESDCPHEQFRYKLLIKLTPIINAMVVEDPEKKCAAIIGLTDLLLTYITGAAPDDPVLLDKIFDDVILRMRFSIENYLKEAV